MNDPYCPRCAALDFAGRYHEPSLRAAPIEEQTADLKKQLAEFKERQDLINECVRRLWRD